MGLQQFEQRLERMVEGAFSKGLRGGLQPVEIGRRLTREMDLLRRVGVRGLIAPNFFVVTLSPQDAERFRSFVDVLARELGDAAREHARTEGYGFVGPVEVEVHLDEALRPGRFTVVANVVEGPDGLPAGSLVLPDGSRVILESEPLVIGRLPECAVVLGDPNVSRRHAEVRRQGSEIVVVDLGSTNGTRVNGAPVRERPLADGDQIMVGTTAIRFETS
ncbi:MAG: FhaA domain-containing protein [Acidimicrobiales bacterium]